MNVDVTSGMNGMNSTSGFDNSFYAVNDVEYCLFHDDEQ